MDSVDPATVQNMINTGLTYLQISDELKVLYPSIRRGLSSRSVRRFAQQNDMRLVAKQHKEQELSDAIVEVCMGKLHSSLTSQTMECGRINGTAEIIIREVF